MAEKMDESAFRAMKDALRVGADKFGGLLDEVLDCFEHGDFEEAALRLKCWFEIRYDEELSDGDFE